MGRLPLLVPCDRNAWILGDEIRLTQTGFLHCVHRVAAQLPSRRYAIMLTQGRAGFLVGYCAALTRGQTALLPANDTESATIELAKKYPSCYAILDAPRTLTIDNVDIQKWMTSRGSSEEIPTVGETHVAAILQTSGSTGDPQSHKKTWAELVADARRWRRRFAIDSSDFIVATVPPQHMFGFESSAILPLQSGAGVYAGLPFYPADVADALSRESNATLMTTPVHLRSFLRSDVNWPTLRQIISSTMALDARTARDGEHRFQTRISEIFGSTETGAIASRRTAADRDWQCLDGLKIKMQDGQAHITNISSKGSVCLPDRIKILDNEVFRLLGRPTDMIKVAGNRASMADLNRRLAGISGVIDGVFFCRRDETIGIDRLIAIVVAPGVEESHIRAELARQLDPVFLPRRIYFVDKLPRNAVGKLPDDAVRSLLTSLARA